MAGSSGMISAKWVGWRHRLTAGNAKALRWPRNAVVMRIRLFLARLSESWRDWDGSGHKAELSENSLELLVGDLAGVSDIGEDLSQCELAVREELDRLADCSSASIAFQKFLEWDGFIPVVAWLGSSKDVVDSGQQVIAKGAHVLGSTLSDLDEVVHEDVSVSK
jgi:hypothetical protein